MRLIDSDTLQRGRFSQEADVIIDASVSCIYGLGSPEDYENENLKIEVGQEDIQRGR